MDVAFFAMTLWLLRMADSATSSVCLALGCAVIAAAHSKTVKRHPAFLTVSIPVGICLYCCSNSPSTSASSQCWLRWSGGTLTSPAEPTSGASSSAREPIRSLALATRASG